MAPRLVSDTELIGRLSRLFRRVGFDGASIGAIAEATGLQKSSLYHRFPGGKHQMAAQVVAAVADDFASSVLAPADSDATLTERIAALAADLDRYYDGGRQYCLLDMLTVGDPGAEATSNLASAAASWIEAFAALARESGADDATAVARAQDAIAAIEGALVMARVTGDRAAFERAIASLPERLAGTPAA